VFLSSTVPGKAVTNRCVAGRFLFHACVTPDKSVGALCAIAASSLEPQPASSPPIRITAPIPLSHLAFLFRMMIPPGCDEVSTAFRMGSLSH
jgi:hypothetical protein